MLEELPSVSKQEQKKNTREIEVEEVPTESLEESLEIINPDQYELLGPSESLN